jgi:hypothetical protein
MTVTKENEVSVQLLEIVIGQFIATSCKELYFVADPFMVEAYDPLVDQAS